MPMYFTIVVPVYNNSNTLQRVFQHVRDNFQGLQHNYEIVFVNDGSSDESLQTLLKLREQHDNISIVSLAKNYTQTIAVLVGFKYAKGDFLIVISADLQEEEQVI